MYVQRICIAPFDLAGALDLAHLKPGLNAIELPSAAAARLLQQTLVRVLFARPERFVARGDRTMVRLSGQHNGQMVQLSSVDRADGGQTHEVAIADQTQLVSCSLADHLGIQTGVRTYITVYTNRLPPRAMLARWRRAQLVTTLVGEMAVRPRTLTDEDTRLLRELDTDQLVARIEQLGQRRGQLIRRLKSSSQAAARYIRAMNHLVRVEEERERVRGELEKARARQQLIERVLLVADEWAQRGRVEAELAAGGDEREVSEADARRIELLSRRIRQLRRRRDRMHVRELSELRRAVPPLRRQLRKAKLLLAVSARAQRMERQLSGPATRLSAPHGSKATGTPSQQNVAEGMDERIEALRPIARVLTRTRRAKSRLLHKTRNDSELSETPAAQTVGSSDETANQLRQRHAELGRQLAEARRRLDQLKAQVHNLLAQQIVPLAALVAPGLLVALGLATMVGGLWLGSGAPGWTTTSLGAVVVVAACLFRSGLRRAPWQESKSCRREIDRLLHTVQTLGGEQAEVEALLGQTVSGDPLAAGRADAPLPARSSAPVVGSRRLRHILRRRRSALAEWREALKRFGLPPELSPRKVWFQLKRSAPARPARREASPVADPEWNDIQFGARRRWLDRWKGRALELLADPDLTADGTTVAMFVSRLKRHRSGIRQRLAEVQRRMQQLVARYRRQKKARIKKYRLERQSLLERAGVAGVRELNERIARQRDRMRLRQEYQRLTEVVDSKLAASGDQAKEMIHLLETCSTTQLLGEQQTAINQSDVLDRQLHQLDRQQEHWRRQREQLSGDVQIEALRQELSVVRQQLESAVTRWQATKLAAALIKDLTMPAGASPPPGTAQNESTARQGLGKASSWFAALTHNTQARIGYVHETGEFVVSEADEAPTRLADLPHARQLLAMLSLQLALVAQLAARRIELPVILTDSCLVGSRRTWRRIVQVLDRAAAEGIQIVLLMTRSPAVALLRAEGVRLLVMSKEPTDGSDQARNTGLEAGSFEAQCDAARGPHNVDDAVRRDEARSREQDQCAVSPPQRVTPVTYRVTPPPASAEVAAQGFEPGPGGELLIETSKRSATTPTDLTGWQAELPATLNTVPTTHDNDVSAGRPVSDRVMEGETDGTAMPPARISRDELPDWWPD